MPHFYDSFKLIFCNSDSFKVKIAYQFTISYFYDFVSLSCFYFLVDLWRSDAAGKGWFSPDARGSLLLSFACSAPNGKKV